MNLKRKDTPESREHWDYAERTAREVEAEIVRERDRANPLTSERVNQLLETMDGQHDDTAVLFICPWLGPELTCGELRKLLRQHRRAKGEH
jgi:hypothetical protein